jgi:glucose/mannose-6-phosphate isomerase
MLDNLDFIAQIDKNNGLAILAGQAHQLAETFDVDTAALTDVQNIVVAGMGGSVLAAEFMLNWKGSELPVPLNVCRGYALPGYVDEKTLVVVSSYSGNTEETLSCLEDAISRSAQIVIMTSGGALLKKATEHDITYYQIPGGLQPRHSLLYQVKALAALLESIGLLDGATKELEIAGEWANNQIAPWVRDVPTAENPAKQLAGKLFGKIGVFYAGPTLEFIARNVKIALNENAKNLAFSYVLPEFNHNEFQGWDHPQNAPIAVVELQSSLDNEEIAKRFSISNRLLSGSMPAPTIVQAQGDTQVKQLVWCVLFSGMVSGYLAVLNGEDPLPVAKVQKLKAELAAEAHGAN